MLRRSTQPIHLAAMAAVITLAIFLDRCRRASFVLFEVQSAGRTLWPLVYLSSFSILFGAQMWMTFVSGTHSLRRGKFCLDGDLHVSRTEHRARSFVHSAASYVRLRAKRSLPQVHDPQRSHCHHRFNRLRPDENGLVAPRGLSSESKHKK